MKPTIAVEARDELNTIQDFVRWAVSQFNQTELYYGHGTNNAWDDAIQLILPSLFLPLDIPEQMFNCVLTTSEKALLADRIQMRINQRIPTAYITNKSWFCGYEMYVDERVLIPRSPIAELIDHYFSGLATQPPKMILDLCTGSGCIAIACAYAFPDAEVDAVDLSINALQVAEFNIQHHGLEERVIPICSDLFDDVPPVQYDLIVTNPPYVDAEDMDDLPLEYEKEPVFALEAGDDGLTLVRRILAKASHYLTDNGILICEVGNSMVHLMAEYPDVPFHWITFERGGDGVFMLTKAQLLAYQNRFIAS